MFRKFWSWLERNDLEQRRRHAAAHYALCIAAGDTRRASRLRAVIDQLGAQLDDKEPDVNTTKERSDG